MRVYKEKQFLIFDLDDGKTVKYDFAKKEAIGKSGNVVKDLRTQLSGYTIDDIFDGCVDKNYAEFLRWIKKRYKKEYGYVINNIGTILEHVNDYSKYEQFFSAGIGTKIGDIIIGYTIDQIPRGLIKICKEHDFNITSKLIEEYKMYPDAINLAFKTKFISLTDHDLDVIFNYCNSQYKNRQHSKFIILIDDYGYTTKSLLNYIDYCKTFEAFNYASGILEILFDYATMMRVISPKFDKYPRHLLTTHQIATRNYQRLKYKFDEEAFKKRINKDMQVSFGEYIFIYPKSTQEIKDEAVAQNNCVASYISRVIDGECDILFLRKKAFLDESLVTIEVQNGKIVQAKQRFNDPVTKKQQEVIDRWNEWYKNKKIEVIN